MIKEAICPNCGAEGTVGRYCEFCGTKIVELKKDTEYSTTIRKTVLDFKISQDEAIKIFLKNLAQKDAVPSDIFNKLQITEVSPVFIPMYSYIGSYQANWSCLKIETEKYKVGDETKEIEKKYPMDGVAGGNFSFLLPNCDIDSLPSSFNAFFENIKYDNILYGQTARKNLNSEEQTYIIEEKGDSQAIVWNNSDCGKLLDSDIENSVHAQLPRIYEDLSYSYSTNGGIGRAFLLATWTIDYKYNEEKYDFIIDGTGHYICSNSPIDENEKKSLDELNKTIKDSKGNAIFCGLLGGILLFVSLVALIAITSNVTIDHEWKERFNPVLLLLTDGLCAVSLYLLGKVRRFLMLRQESESKRNNILNDSLSLRCNNLTNALNTNSFGISDIEICKELSANVSKITDTLETKENSVLTGGCMPILIVISIVIAGILNLLVLLQYSNHAKQVELEEYNVEMTEKHVRDSIEHEKAMQQQKEERKKRNYRPSAPTPSFSDVEVIGLPNGIKQIRMTSEKENSIYEFNKQGFLISVKCNRDYTTFTSSHSYTIKQGKLISQDGKEVEYNKVSANEDIISCDNYTLCNVTYDSKNRIVKIKDEYDTSTFAYDEENNAHEEREDIWGNAKTEEKMSIPILDIIGSSIYIPKNWEDKITSSDEQGRPTEIVYDGLLHKETVKITYW